MLVKARNASLACLLLLFYTKGISQTTRFEKKTETIKTYPFSDPNPIPPLAVNDDISRFYPYFTFDGYSHKGLNQPWQVVTLENPYIIVKILPQVGGKVWGAIEKKTGREFIYLNHVMKFRSIGIRGPWTSGGIEHNFGLDIGHAPWAASPVDYIINKEPDGSVNCVVGGMDLASRTQWRIIIHLPANAACFETKGLWYNPTPFHQSYMSWENAAFKATDDLQFYFPGTHFLGHNGESSPWPVDKEGRNLSRYKENNFGSSKSYHVVGSARNWFGGYWHNEKYGFGHWSPYSDDAGKKLWIWSLARDGAIWEDLLTESDGQYIEAQAGVKFNQADYVSGFHSPFKQLSFRPGYTETKTDTWFPVMGTRGIADASPTGVLNVIQEKDSLLVYISANKQFEDS